MPSRLPVVLTSLAALALAVGPALGLLHGIPEPLGFVRVAAALLAAWGLSRRGLGALLLAAGAVTAWDTRRSAPPARERR